jgi:hypothetical protein
VALTKIQINSHGSPVSNLKLDRNLAAEIKQLTTQLESEKMKFVL